MRQRALDTINLKPADRFAHTEYSMEYHETLIQKISGNTKENPARIRTFYDEWNYDFLWVTDGGLHANWGERGRATDMGHAAYNADGSDQRSIQECPFKTPEDVWNFDAVKEYGLPDFQKQVHAYQELTNNRKRNFPGQLSTGGYYPTLISGAIASFGWDMLLLAASEGDKFEKVLESFFQFTLHHMKAWAETDVEVIIQHDDFVWTQGPFMHPDYYRRVIIPRYKKLWEPLKKAGKKVLFCSDGVYLQFMPDILEAGADGLFFEPDNDFETIAREFGSVACLVGSAVDCRDLTFNKWDAVQASMDKTFQLARTHCKGLIFCTGNHIPANISDEMCEKYIAYFKENSIR